MCDILEIIKTNKPHMMVYSKEPFYNIYKDCISYDYSGEVTPLTKEDLEVLYKESFEPNFISDSPFQYLLINLY